MGAFGELLKERWGYVERYQKPIPPKKPTKQELLEKDNERLEHLKQSGEQIREKLSIAINYIKENDGDELFKTEEHREKYRKWKETFLNETLTIFNLPPNKK